MASDPAVSLILPTHNRAALLPAAIQSVLDQTFQDFELIVVDDGSTDETEKVLGGIRDPRIQKIRLANRVGAAEARNIGLAKARADWIGFMDSDVQWAPEKLERQFMALEDAPDRVGALFCAFWLRENGRIRRVPGSGLRVPPQGWFDRLLWGNLVDTPSLLVQRGLLEGLGGFDGAMPRFQDWDLALRLSRETEIRFLDEPLYLSTRDGDSISSNSKAAVAALNRLLGKHSDLLERNPKLHAHFKAYTAHFECLSGNPQAARALLRHSIRIHPRGVEAPVCYLLSCLPPRMYQAVILFRDRFLQRLQAPPAASPAWVKDPPGDVPHG